MPTLPTVFETLITRSREQDAFGGVMTEAAIAARVAHCERVWAAVQQLCGELGLTSETAIASALWRLWLPLAQDLIAQYQKLQRPVVQGILGGQGTGKTTLAAILHLLLEMEDYRSVEFSLDDLYKSYIERQQIQQADPRLAWRGPPGTHDVAIGIELLDKLRQPKRGRPVVVPRFDKSACGGAGDKAQPEIIDPVEIVIFEGWFVGVRPVSPAAFAGELPEPIVSEGDRTFAQDMNEQLFDYVPLWHRLDRLLVLKPVDYRLSKRWRTQAEQRMKATGRSGMSDAQISDFVDYFWKALHPELFIEPLTQNAMLTDWVVEIDEDHSLGRVYAP
ncbi:MAG: glycerate kinase [Spirulina sp. SIO3F2]|nr:glycerate kinase [Spirulina sp. SIO3F2]